MRSGRSSAGAALFSNLTNNMLYRPDQPLLFTPFEYAHGDTGIDDGDYPQGWDGSCFLRASLGAWGFGRQSAVVAHPTSGLVSASDVRDPLASADGHDPAVHSSSKSLRGGLQSAAAAGAVDTFHLTLPSSLYRADSHAVAVAGGIVTTIPLGAYGQLLAVSVRVEGPLALSEVPAAAQEENLRLALVSGAMPAIDAGGSISHGWEKSVPCERHSSAGSELGRADFLCAADGGRSIRVIVHAADAL